jgi:hypothetical protein
MNKFRQLYKSFFGLQEQAAKPGNMPKILPAAEIEKSTKAVAKYGDAMKQAGLIDEEEIDEAKLINHLTDYKGGVEYVLRDPQQAQAVAEEIRQWSEKKGFNIIKTKISKNGKVGYFYFRLGQDPALESQKIQGYIAQKPEVKHFRFNVRGQQAAPTQSEPVANPPMRRNPNI